MGGCCPYIKRYQTKELIQLTPIIMKKILNALFMTLLAVFTFSSCSDVPAPYDILGEGDVPGLTGDGTKENPYNIATASLKQDGSVAWVQGYIV